MLLFVSSAMLGVAITPALSIPFKDLSGESRKAVLAAEHQLLFSGKMNRLFTSSAPNGLY